MISICSSHRILLVLLFAAVAFMPFAGADPAGSPKAFEPDDTIADLEAKIAHNGFSFQVAPNWVTTLSPEEREGLRGRRPSIGTKAAPGTEDMGPLKLFLAQPPTESVFSWTNVEGRSYIGPVRNQGNCGSCYAFGAAAAAEGSYNVTFDLYDAACIDFSEAFIAFCLGSVAPYSYHFGGCDGADYDYYELQALVDEGICLESEFPYTDVNPGTCAYWDTSRTRFTAWYRVPCGDINAIKTAIRNFGVVDAAILTTAAFDAYAGGVYEDTNTSCTDCEYAETDHAIALVGWDDNPPEGGGGCWILRNSWGEDWGEGGYMRIRYTSAAVSCAVTYLVFGDPTPGVPAATTGGAADILAGSAELGGSVMPAGSETTYHFEYGETTAYGASTAPTSAGAGHSVQMVSASVVGLSPFSTYHYRLVAANAYGTAHGKDRTFITRPDHPVPPTAETLAATAFPTSAILKGLVCANYGSATGYFEYGTTKTFGSSAIARDEDGGQTWEGISSIPVSALVKNLSPGTTYFYRFVATSDGGTAHGQTKAFVTLPTGQYLHENFERGGALPPGWSNVRVVGDANWTCAVGAGTLGHPFFAVGGQYNALLFKDSWDPKSTRLITPSFSLTGAQKPTLFFGLHMEEWQGDQDILRVYFRTSPTAEWTLLRTFMASVAPWTPVSIPLPATGAQCAIAFDGSALYGYGICIDDVAVGEALPEFRFTALPMGGWYEEGRPLDLTVGVANAVGEVLYQWRRNGTPIPDATEATLHIDALSESDQGMYDCEVNDEAKARRATPAVYVRVVAAGALPAVGIAGLSLFAAAAALVGARAARRNES